MIVFLTSLMHKFFTLIHLLSPLHVSSTIMLIFMRAIVLVQHLVSSLSLGDCSRLREDCVLNSHLKRVTIPDAVLTQMSS